MLTKLIGRTVGPIRRYAFTFPAMSKQPTMIFDRLAGSGHISFNQGAEYTVAFSIADISRGQVSPFFKILYNRILEEKSLPHNFQENLAVPNRRQNKDLFKQLNALQGWLPVKADHRTQDGPHALFNQITPIRKEAYFFIAGNQSSAESKAVTIETVPHNNSSGVLLFRWQKLALKKIERFFKTVYEQKPLVIAHDKDLIPIPESLYEDLFLLADHRDDQTIGRWSGATDYYEII